MKLSLNSMSERERRMVYLCSAVAALVLVLGVIVPLDRSVAQAHQRVEKKTGDLAWMRSVAPEVSSSRPIAAPSKESLLVVVDRSARESNLGSAFKGTAPSVAGGLSVRFEKAPFDTLIAWLARLSEQNGIRVDSATIDSAGNPGIVNASVALSTH